MWITLNGIVDPLHNSIVRIIVRVQTNPHTIAMMTYAPTFPYPAPAPGIQYLYVGKERQTHSRGYNFVQRFNDLQKSQSYFTCPCG